MLPVLLPADYLAKCFSSAYGEAQRKFKQHARDRQEHSGYREFVYREKGPADEKLFTASLWLGRLDAPRVLVIQSGTHGVEGFAGSAVQIDYLLQKQKPTDALAVLLIHALNPYGFAWLRRVNERGVDLNRNFVDFRQALPDNHAYTELAPALLPAEGVDWTEADRQLLAYRERHGQRALELAISGGQYTSAEGLFYGGDAPSQSRQYLEQIWSEFNLQQRQQVAVLDIHTGLGPFGYGELICDHPPGSRAVAWAKQVYGESVTEPALGSSSSVPKTGLIDYGWQGALGERVCFITLEFGTYSVEAMFAVLRRDHVLHRQPVNWDDPATQRAKQDLCRHFYPATADWQEMVLMRGRQVIGQAMQGLLESV